MFTHFFHELKAAEIPVSLREYLTLLESLDADIIDRRMDAFYFLSRAALVKDERNLDKFDRVFGRVFKGIQTPADMLETAIPEEWLRKLAEKYLTDEEKKEIEALGGFEKVMEMLKKRLAEQKGRHQGGNKWIGTAGTSPFGAEGYNPEGVRIGQNKSRHQKAIKVWDKREYKNLDDSVELGTRNIKVALRRLRRFAREGAPEVLDLPGTIKSTADKGYLDINLIPERRNTIKVLLLLDAGGSMDPHVRMCEELFSAAKTEFKNLEYFYFHNCPYENLWQDNRRRHTRQRETWDVLHKYPSDYKVIFVGDAAMSPYELTYIGGSLEHWNEEPGGLWLQRFLDTYESAVWLNPVAERYWESMASTQMVKQLFSERMYPLTLEGLDKAMHELARK